MENDKIKFRRCQSGTNRNDPFTVRIDGNNVLAFSGETVAAVILASGKNIVGYSYLKNRPGSMYCGIGDCYYCTVTIDNIPSQRACQTLVKPGMIIEFER